MYIVIQASVLNSYFAFSTFVIFRKTHANTQRKT